MNTAATAAPSAAEDLGETTCRKCSKTVRLFRNRDKLSHRRPWRPTDSRDPLSARAPENHVVHFYRDIHPDRTVDFTHFHSATCTRDKPLPDYRKASRWKGGYYR